MWTCNLWTTKRIQWYKQYQHFIYILLYSICIRALDTFMSFCLYLVIQAINASVLLQCQFMDNMSGGVPDMCYTQGKEIGNYAYQMKGLCLYIYDWFGRTISGNVYLLIHLHLVICCRLCVDESAYRQEVSHLAVCFGNNILELNQQKTWKWWETSAEPPPLSHQELCC